MNSLAGFFHAAGYLRIPELLTTEQVGVLTGVTGRIVSGLDPKVAAAWRTRIDKAVSADPEYEALATSDRMTRALRPVLGPDIELVQDRHNHVSVYPVASVDRLHRDVLQWSRSILTVLVYLSDCTHTAAATRIIPGSHLWPSTGAPNNGGTWLDQSPDHGELVDQAVTIPAGAGDAVLMHGQLYHAGAGASPAEPRIVFALAYRSVDELSQEDSRHSRLVSGRRAYRGRGAR